MWIPRELVARVGVLAGVVVVVVVTVLVVVAAAAAGRALVTWA